MKEAPIVEALLFDNIRFFSMAKGMLEKKAEYTERRLCVQEGEEHGATI